MKLELFQAIFICAILLNRINCSVFDEEYEDRDDDENDENDQDDSEEPDEDDDEKRFSIYIIHISLYIYC